MKLRTLLVAVGAAIAVGAAACTAGPSAAPPGEVVLMTHDSFAISDDVLAAFEAETGVPITVLEAGDAGSMLNQAILTKDAPLADVLYGVDNTFLGRALSEELFIPYAPAALGDLDPDLIPTDLDPQGHVVPIDYGDVCVNYDKSAFGEDLPPPTGLADLIEPAYRDMLVVEDPATSSPGLAFLLATVAAFGEDSAMPWTDYWQALVDNGVEVVPGWEQAYYGRFSGGSGEGDRPLVVSYASSPVAEVYFSELDEAPTGVVTDGCFRQIEYAGILAGTDNVEIARKLIDFMVSPRFQEDIPLNMFVYPANTQARLPDVFVEFSQIPDRPSTLDPDVIDANRERWIETWTRIVR